MRLYLLIDPSFWALDLLISYSSGSQAWKSLSVPKPKRLAQEIHRHELHIAIGSTGNSPYYNNTYALMGIFSKSNRTFVRL